jgi:putative ABC transport system permease protein
MFYHYIKIAWRSLLKYRYISLINLFGLCIGITSCLLILIYVIQEKSFDKYHTNANRIYRVTRSFYNSDGSQSLHLGTVAPPIGPLLYNYFPDIEKVTQLLQSPPTKLKKGENSFLENQLFFADENLLQVFSVKMLKEASTRHLLEPFSVIISDKIAAKYFNNENPLDKSINFNNLQDCKVTGVFESFPANSHIHPEILVSFNTLKDNRIYGEEQLRTSFTNNAFLTYLLLPPNYPADKIEKQFPVFLKQHVHKTSNNINNTTFEPSKLHLQKLTDIHLHSHLDLETEVNGDIKTVFIFSSIALFILVIACINYMNLTTARSVLRAKEIGVRKVVGAEKQSLILQFLSESVILTFVATFIAILITQQIIPFVNNAVGLHLQFSSLLNPSILGTVFLASIFIGLLSGFYPALLLSSFNPSKVFKSNFKISGNISLKKFLVGAQFGISIFLIICTIVIFRQLVFIRQTNPGYNKEQIINVNFPATLNNNYDALKNELLSSKNILNLSRSSLIPTQRLVDSSPASTVLSDSSVESKAAIKFVAVDPNFIPTYSINLKAGRNFYPNSLADTNSFILNESAIEMLGFKGLDNAIGTSINYGGIDGKIVGVMENINFESMRQNINPTLLLVPNDGFRQTPTQLSIKIDTKNTTATLNYIESIWRKHVSDFPFEFQFLDERYNNLYIAEKQQATLFSAFSIIAIILAALGLLGLSAFTITQRLKEIGIRKILGASDFSIIQLLSKEFTILFGISAAVAFPVAWIAMHKWLENFAFRTEIVWWIFIVSAAAAAFLLFAIVATQGWIASHKNPVENIRPE